MALKKRQWVPGTLSVLAGLTVLWALHTEEPRPSLENAAWSESKAASVEPAPKNLKKVHALEQGR